MGVGGGDGDGVVGDLLFRVDFGCFIEEFFSDHLAKSSANSALVSSGACLLVVVICVMRIDFIVSEEDSFAIIYGWLLACIDRATIMYSLLLCSIISRGWRVVLFL